MLVSSICTNVPDEKSCEIKGGGQQMAAMVLILTMHTDIVTHSGLITYLKVSRNVGFKCLVCCSSPMVEAMCTKISHVLHQFLTFQSIHCASSHN